MTDDFATHFLPWLHDVSNERWRNLAPAAVENPRLGDWRRGMRWRGGLTDPEIAAAEATFGVRFPPDYRAFLAVLHTVDPGPDGSGLREADGRTRPYFCDWTGDAKEVRDRLDSPLDGLLWSIEADGGWFSAWGPRPASPEARARRVRELAAAGPEVIPVCGHRYLVGPANRAGSPVLSIYGADVIFCASDLEDFLRRELVWPPTEVVTKVPDDADLGLWADVIAGYDVHR